ncbi:TIGR03985 family CRISPR-associated protein [Chamaesiphon polymorphus]|uniref:TIGR03985 family CRISPR-associated protein n=1 Tax=Chamaesiphon polymorphus CCALA 037 TaxID=2107692 RepID=A0A2T1GLK5_9CYAN|nr:TIGR03985 family CRISPR-associated protein [Chamaesiphon polymorphus]PSB58761.1 TIGR03985 family CRISPR-associated protein [Chamaesiphon polymorphus CCALA 037]
MPEFNYLPSISVLQALVGVSLADSLANVNKAVRLWYSLRELANEFDAVEFTDGEWRKHLYKSPNNNRDKKPTEVDGCNCTKTIKDILFDFQPDLKWQEWKESFIKFYLDININHRTQENLENFLNQLESDRPLYVTGKTLLNDLNKLVNRGYLEVIDSRFKLVDEFPLLPTSMPASGESSGINKSDEAEIYVDLPVDFRSFTDLFWQQQNDIQRFYLHADYHILDEAERRIAEYRRKLREIWQKGSGVPCRLTYQSSSQKQIYTAIIYPVCIYYYQRSFYLCAFGCAEDKTESNWYNYRLDRICSLECLDWEDNAIPPSLIEKCRDVGDDELIDDIELGIETAYGFDIERPNRLMLLRFDRDFHDRYIKNTWRHNTFKLVDRDKIDEVLNKSGLDKSDRALIEIRIKSYAQDAYYTMNYRVGDNSVIMRLRAWCPNVEVLFPLDLRQRMRDDMQKTWELYSEDE